METPIRFADFDRIVFFTGAGVSAESGVPTYRGQGGIWAEYDYERYACQEAFDADPERVWEFHNMRRAAVAACEPNPAHEVIARVEQARPQVTVVTQNIDGLHQRAGTERIHELHGSLWKVRCDATEQTRPNFDVPFSDLVAVDGVGPRGYWRPAIVWFGDMLDGVTIEASVQAIRGCQLFVAVGTSATVYPAAALPHEARGQGAVTVEVNPEATPMSSLYDVVMRGPASEMLTAMAEGLT